MQDLQVFLHLSLLPLIQHTNISTVLYESIRTVTSIRASAALLESAARSIGEFIHLRNHNLKYLGIKALAAIVKVSNAH
jgi:AP-4 complex subunit epsilon-1